GEAEGVGALRRRGQAHGFPVLKPCLDSSPCPLRALRVPGGENSEENQTVSELARARRMFEYDLWANARVNESLRSAAASVEKEGAASQAPSLVKALQIWGHVQWARRMWLSRLGRAEPP